MNFAEEKTMPIKIRSEEINGIFYVYDKDGNLQLLGSHIEDMTLSEDPE